MKIEWNDIRCILTVLNVICVLLFGKAFVIIGLVVALFGIIKDIITNEHINAYIMHGANVLMYMCMMFGKIYA